MKKNLLLLLSIFLLGISGFAQAQTSPQPAVVPSKAELKKAIAAGDHKTLAQYYKALADEERAEAAMHEELAKTYRESYVHYDGIQDNIPDQCNQLKDHALKKAAQYDQMAALETRLASIPPKPAMPTAPQAQ